MTGETPFTGCLLCGTEFAMALKDVVPAIALDFSLVG
jgi:hypothetical protein